MKTEQKKVIKIKAKIAPVERVSLKIHTEYIKLDSALKLCGIAQTGGHAKILIQDGEIFVNGAICTERGKKLKPGDELKCGREIFVIEAS